MHRYVREGAIALAIIGGIGIHLATQPLREQLLPLDEIVRRITPQGATSTERTPPRTPSVPAPSAQPHSPAEPLLPQGYTHPSTSAMRPPVPLEPLPLIDPARTQPPSPPEPTPTPSTEPVPRTPPAPAPTHPEPVPLAPHEVRAAAVPTPIEPTRAPPSPQIAPPAPTAPAPVSVQPQPYRAPEPIPQPPPPEPARPASDLEGIISAWQAAAVSRMHIIAPLVDEIAREFSVKPSTIYGIVLSESSYYPDASSGEKRGLLQYTPEVFSAIIEVNSYRHEPYYDRALTDDVWSPEASLRAYRIELRALRDHSGITDPTLLHLIRASREPIADLNRYFASAPIVEQHSRIERRIDEAERLLAFTSHSPEYRSMIASRGTVSERLAGQLDAMIATAKDVHGEYLAAYLTNAVAYARVLERPGTVRSALANAQNDRAISNQITSLERRLNEPLE